jgi:hypothetical protein
MHPLGFPVVPELQLWLTLIVSLMFQVVEFQISNLKIFTGSVDHISRSFDAQVFSLVGDRSINEGTFSVSDLGIGNFFPNENLSFNDLALSTLFS